jgi:phage FluMu gp28-like protein
VLPLSYQQAVLTDPARFVLLCMARQTGKSFALAMLAAAGALAGQSWVLLSAGERQSRELMGQVRRFLEAAAVVFEFREQPFADDTRWSELRIVLPNGASIIGLPANPNTARGFSANVALDEFAFHEDSTAIWRALYPIVTRGYRLVVSSTPNGRSNQFYRLWTDASGRWSRHQVTIHDAVAAGLAVDVDELRAGINDPTAWAQEYECRFVDEATALLAYDLISACEDAELAAPSDAAGVADLAEIADLYGGYDVGRRHDMSVLAAGQKVGSVLFVRALRRWRSVRFAEQQARLESWFRLAGHRRTAIDATGLGMQLAEWAVERFGRHRAEAVTFTAASVERVGMALLGAMQDRRIRIPPDRDLRESLHAVQRVVTPAGNVRVQAPRDGAGHSDEFYALALLADAASTPVAQPYVSLAG